MLTDDRTTFVMWNILHLKIWGLIAYFVFKELNSNINQENIFCLCFPYLESAKSLKIWGLIALLGVSLLKLSRKLARIMGRIASTCLRSLLKFVNSMMGLLGIAMILYGLWMIRVWQRDTDGSPYVDFNSTGPW